MKERFVSKRIKTFGGPVSPAIISNDFAFVSGQISTNPENGEVIKGTIDVETRNAINNLKVMIEDLGATLDNVVKCDVFISSFNNFDGMNKVYLEYFGAECPPARSCVSTDLWDGMLVEISAIVDLKK